jgi:hypothetical protein
MFAGGRPTVGSAAVNRYRLPVLLLAPGLAGCLATTPIQVSDHNTFLPSARVSFQRSADPETPSRPHDGTAFELGVTGNRGRGGQPLAAGQPDVVLGGQTFTGPLQLTNKFDFRYYEGVFRFRKFFNDALGVEALIGLGYTTLDVTVSAPGLRATENRDMGGFVVGLGGVWRVLPSTSLQARGTVFSSFDAIFFPTEPMTNTRVDIHLVQALGRNAALRAGWTEWRLSSENSPSSDFKATFSGPALGLELMF